MLSFSCLCYIVRLYDNHIVTQADDSRGSKAFIGVCLWFCLFVRSITQKRMIPKSSNLVQPVYRKWSWDILQVMWLLGQRSKSQVTKCKKYYWRRSSGRHEFAPRSTVYSLLLYLKETQLGAWFTILAVSIGLVDHVMICILLVDLTTSNLQTRICISP